MSTSAEATAIARTESDSRRRLRAMLANPAPAPSSAFAPLDWTEIRTAAELPARVATDSAAAFRVASFELAEELIARGAASSRILVESGARAALSAPPADPRDPVLPPLPYASPQRLCVVLPTYNERDNVADMVAAITRYISTDVLIVDDASPDGTGVVADALASADPRIHVLHRAAKEGLGRAYIAGFRWALERGYERLFEMDCDFSHAPWDLPRLATAADGADLVLGSRYRRGGRTRGWHLGRQALSRGANLYAKLLLGFRISDWTGGFRCYRAECLQALDLDRIAATGYSFQIEMAWRVLRGGGRIREIPIHFVDRNVGKSKMSRATALEAVWLVPRLRWS